jgi:hypothetical protein
MRRSDLEHELMKIARVKYPILPGDCPRTISRKGKNMLMFVHSLMPIFANLTDAEIFDKLEKIK